MSVVIFLIFLITSLIQNNVIAAEDGCPQQHCIAVADVGSTGSRLFFYSYDTDSSHTPIDITMRWSNKIKPGIATIEQNPATIDAYLTILFSQAPAHYPVYFYATAGVRLLSQPKQKNLYSYVQQWFDNQNWRLMSARTLSGNEEALYGWLAINYQLDRLTNDDLPNVGVLDIGGASVQIAFPLTDTDDTVMNTQDVWTVSLYNRHFKVFTHSFLGLGQTEVAHQFLDDNACFITNYTMPSGQVAAGDVYRCETNMLSLINDIHSVNKIVSPMMAKNSITTWYTLGGINEMVKDKPFHFNNHQYTSEELLTQANFEVCRQQWTTLNNQYSNNDYLYEYCLLSAYYYALLVEGYRIAPQQTLQYLDNEQNSSWTLGVILHQLN